MKVSHLARNTLIVLFDGHLHGTCLQLQPWFVVADLSVQREGGRGEAFSLPTAPLGASMGLNSLSSMRMPSELLQQEQDLVSINQAPRDLYFLQESRRTSAPVMGHNVSRDKEFWHRLGLDILRNL